MSRYLSYSKIILKKTGNLKRNRGVKVGMTICRSQSQEESQTSSQKQTQILRSNYNCYKLTIYHVNN